MKLEDQVCTLEQAKRLKERGVKQESLFYWVRNIDDKFKITICESEADKVAHIHMQCDPFMGYEYYSAFTCAELGELISNRGNDYWRGYEVMKEFAIMLRELTETHARANWLITILTKSSTNE